MPNFIEIGGVTRKPLVDLTRNDPHDIVIVGRLLIIINATGDPLKSQVVLLQTAHSWANAGVLLGACMHRERGSFRNN